MSDKLRFGINATESDLRAAIVETGQITYAHGLLCASDGNISVRLPDGNILITPSGIGKGRLSTGDLLVIDPQGNIVKPADDPLLRSTTEQAMHLEVYRQRCDVRAVLHAHPPCATALTVVRSEFRMDVLPEMVALLGQIPITDLAMPSSSQTADVIREPIRHHDAVMIRQHGSLTVGKTLEEALINLERVEYIAKTILLAEMMGPVNPLPEDMLSTLRQSRLEGMVREVTVQILNEKQ
ncbi:MAG: class II aldolase/adducin family protein [Chloroflexi bacterium]|nr:class II aldolase/adducin family protein [Chloroflexota bacterium]